MRKFILSLFLLSSCSFHLYSQTLLDLYPKYLGFGFGDKIYEEDIERINAREDHILNYEMESFELYKDSIAKPGAITQVQIQLEEDMDLQKVFNDLALFPNLFYLKIDNLRLFGDPVMLSFPKDLSGISNVEFLNLYGDFGVDQEVLNRIAGLPKLRILAFTGFSREKIAAFDLQEFQNLEGLSFAGNRVGPSFPQSVEQLSGLKSIAISADLYPDFAEEFAKFQVLPHLNNVRLQGIDLPKGSDTVFKGFSGIRRLELNGVKISNMDQFLENLSTNDSLVHLKLFRTQSEKFTGGFKHLRQLKYLKLGRPGDSLSLPADIFSLENLRYLEVFEMDSLTSISPGIANLKKLDSLNIAYNDLHFLPVEIGELENLKYLNVSNNSLKILPSSIGKLEKLKVLLAGSNQLTGLPPELGNLRSLEVLSAGQDILELPTEIGALENLRTLYLAQNLLTFLPGGMGRLKNLEELYLTDNDLLALPQDFGGMTALEILDLSRNLLTDLPVSFGNLHALETLRLENNNLQSLPESFGDLSNLTKLLLNNRSNASIDIYNPKTRKFETDLNRLARKDNSLVLLPLSFSRLKNLENIWLSGNPLKEERLFRILKDLKAEKYSIYLEHCYIDELPDQGWESILAESIYINDNDITKFPENIKAAPYLRKLNLNRNPLPEFSRYYENREELLIAFKEAGFIDAGELPKTTSMAKAYLDLAYGKKNTAKQLEFFEQAFSLDSAYVAEKIRNDDYAEILLKAKRYDKSIEYFSRAIKEDTLGNIRITNFIVPEFQNRAKAYLAVGDTLAAINDLRVVSERFGAEDWGKAALLAKKIDRDSLAAHLFNKGIESYRKGMDWDVKNNRVDHGKHLSLLELYIISEDFSKARAYLGKLQKEEISRSDFLLLRKYLKLTLEILEQEKSSTEMKSLKREMKEAEISVWSFDLFRQWLKQTEVEPRKRDQILILTNLLEWNLN